MGLRCFHKSLFLFRDANQLRVSGRVLLSQDYQYTLSISSNVFARTFNERCQALTPIVFATTFAFYAKILIARRQALQRSEEK